MGSKAVRPGAEKRLLCWGPATAVTTLPRICSASAFYSGFYVARNGDGLLCTDRDTLQSRSGANCKVKALRELRPIR